MLILRALDIKWVRCIDHHRGESEGRTFGKVDRVRERVWGGLEFFSFLSVSRSDKRVVTQMNAFVLQRSIKCSLHSRCY